MIFLAMSFSSSPFISFKISADMLPLHGASPNYEKCNMHYMEAAVAPNLVVLLHVYNVGPVESANLVCLDTSVSQSALEEALLSNIQHGRMSTLSQLRSRYL